MLKKKKNEESSSVLKKGIKHDEKKNKRSRSFEHSKTAVLLTIKDGNPLYADVHQIKCGSRNGTETKAIFAASAEAGEGEGLIKRASEDFDVSCYRHRSKFFQTAATFSPNENKVPAQVINVPAVHALLPCETGAAANIHENKNSTDARTTAKALHFNFLRRSRDVLKNLQERHDISSKRWQKQSKAFTAFPPRLATSELHLRRIESWGKGKEENAVEIVRDDTDVMGRTSLRRTISTNSPQAAGQRRWRKEEEEEEKELRRGFIAPPRRDGSRAGRVTAELRRHVSCPARVNSLMAPRKQQQQQ